MMANNDKHEKKLFAIIQGVLWSTPVVAAIVVFCFQNFQTKSDAAAVEAVISARQDRLGVIHRELRSESAASNAKILDALQDIARKIGRIEGHLKLHN